MYNFVYKTSLLTFSISDYFKFAPSNHKENIYHPAFSVTCAGSLLPFAVLPISSLVFPEMERDEALEGSAQITRGEYQKYVRAGSETSSPSKPCARHSEFTLGESGSGERRVEGKGAGRGRKR